MPLATVVAAPPKPDIPPDAMLISIVGKAWPMEPKNPYKKLPTPVKFPSTSLA